MIEAYEIKEDIESLIGLVSHMETSSLLAEEESKKACRGIRNNLEYIRNKMNTYLIQKEV